MISSYVFDISETLLDIHNMSISYISFLPLVTERVRSFTPLSPTSYFAGGFISTTSKFSANGKLPT